MSSSIKRMFFLKDTSPKSGEPVVKSYTIDDYKKENEDLKGEIKALYEQLNRRYQDTRNAEHDVLEQRVVLGTTLSKLRYLDKKLENIYDRKGMEKAIVKAANDPKLLYHKAEAFRKIKNAEHEIVGSREIVKSCIDRLKGHLEKLDKY
ncbi:hypothetical protein FPOAC1_011967 [Fusarium poae]|jgi:hypothetical protein|uniref:Uncharacterized protein n=1 Tax=Fusarium poae TaxID=36050 RepID=A0A1B8AFZ2_FUSPO|nr:hypothetical protein FPOAC1_011967 [Fusarium poae]KAG8667145.1 hypothetical protein FPOAC1_011967 [Fusarium poae]OBS19381.1 hypothetical protein FPOA_11106 [Fusarium poae]